jgi:hypothetical protein
MTGVPLDFPNNPTTGQVFDDRWLWDGQKWVSTGGGGGGAVASVFGRIGAVVAAFGDYSFPQIAGQVQPNQLTVFTPTALGAVPAPGSTTPATDVLTAAGTWAAPGGGGGALGVNMQVLKASGTYTPTPGMVSCIVELFGGGGGAGGITSTSAIPYGASGGGGAGSYTRSAFSASQIGASQPVTIGAGANGAASGSSATGGIGGDTYFGSPASPLCSARGGRGGGSWDSTSNWGATGEGGNDQGIGTLIIRGNPGTPASAIPISGGNFVYIGGNGASSPLGGGPIGVAATGGSGAVGANASTPGAGGSGSAISWVGTSPGGNGAPGLCVVTEYIA